MFAWFWPTNNTIVEIDLKLSLLLGEEGRRGILIITSCLEQSQKLYNLGEFLLGQENKEKSFYYLRSLL